MKLFPLDRKFTTLIIHIMQAIPGESNDVATHKFCETFLDELRERFLIKDTSPTISDYADIFKKALSEITK